MGEINVAKPTVPSKPIRIKKTLLNSKPIDISSYEYIDIKSFPEGTTHIYFAIKNNYEEKIIANFYKEEMLSFEELKKAESIYKKQMKDYKVKLKQYEKDLEENKNLEEQQLFLKLKEKYE